MVVSRREAAGAATFSFQRNDATTQDAPRYTDGCHDEAHSRGYKNRMAQESGTASLRRRVVALKIDWPAAA
jgi:hypothetical protein